MFETITQNAMTILENPAGSFALLGVFLLTVAGIYFRRVKLTTHTIIYVSLMLALTIVLHQLRLYHFPQGGSITLGAMIPLLMLSYRYGMGVGALAGFIFGMINLLQNPFILHPVQLLFDYPLPYMAMGLAALFPDRIILSTALAFFGRFACHFISGVVFFSSYAPSGMSPLTYSALVNLSMMVPECLICCVILKVLPIKRLLTAMDRASRN